MATVCCCGNTLRNKPEDFQLTMSPCQCDKPSGPRRSLRAGLPNHVFAKQYAERKRLGLPLETDIERAVRSRWQ